MALETPNLASAVRRAQSRADSLGEDLKKLRQRVRNRDPAVLDNPIEREQLMRWDGKTWVLFGKVYGR